MPELLPIVRALLDARDEAIVIVDARGGGRTLPLRLGITTLGQLIIVPASAGRTWADQERRAIRDALEETGGKRSETARRLGISRTTLWRRLKAERS